MKSTMMEFSGGLGDIAEANFTTLSEADGSRMMSVSKLLFDTSSETINLEGRSTQDATRNS